MTKDEALAGEPVTWGVDWSKDGDTPCVSIIKRLPDGGIEVLAVEYGPSQRPWVGLTEEERSSFWTADYMTQKEWDRLFDSIEDKLKQKNTCTPPVAAGSQAFYGFPHGPVSTPNAGGKCVTAGETAPPKEIDPNQWAFDNGLEST